MSPSSSWTHQSNNINQVEGVIVPDGVQRCLNLICTLDKKWHRSVNPISKDILIALQFHTTISNLAVFKISWIKKFKFQTGSQSIEVPSFKRYVMACLMIDNFGSVSGDWNVVQFRQIYVWHKALYYKRFMGVFNSYFLLTDSFPIFNIWNKKK